jgi:TPP-dependent 2-oxoacid decarboxylase
MILTRLELTISKKVKDFLTPQSEASNPTDPNSDSKPIDQRALLDKIANFFKDKTMLLVLDNAETPSKKDPKNFAEII